MLGKKLAELMSPREEYYQNWQALIDSLQKKEAPWIETEMLNHVHLGSLWVRIAITTLEIDTRLYYLINLIDVSELVNKEIQLWQSRERLLQIINLLPHQIYLKDSNGNYISITYKLIGDPEWPLQVIDKVIDTLGREIFFNYDSNLHLQTITQAWQGQTFTWAQYAEHVRDFALGLAALGFQRGEKVTVVGDNRPRLYWAQLAAQSLGGAAASIGLDDLRTTNPTGVTTGTEVRVAGTLTLLGPLDFSGEVLAIANPILGTLANLTGDAASSLEVFGTGSGIVIPGSLPDLANLILDNPNGADLSGPMSIGQSLTLTDGILGARPWLVTLNPAASVARSSGPRSPSIDGSVVGTSYRT